MISVQPELMPARNGARRVRLTVRDAERVIYADNLSIDSARARTGFLRAVIAKVNNAEATKDLEQQILALLDAPELSADPPNDEAEADADAHQDPAGADPAGLIALGEKNPQTGRIVLSPRRTLPTAEAAVRDFWTHHESGCRTVQHYAGKFMTWGANRWAEQEDQAVRKIMQAWLHRAERYVFNRYGESEIADFESNPTTVLAGVESLKTYVHLPATMTPPSWLKKRPDQPDPRDLLPFPDGTLHVPTGKVLAPTPALFNVNAIDFNYDPNPEPPERWIRFLEQLWGDDLESVQCLQELLGYLLVNDNSLQKACLIVGPKRSGKGTIGRIVRDLVGAGNVAGPTTKGLAGEFGLEDLINKSVGIVSDARFNGDGIGVVVERVLCITGGDWLTISRKHIGSVTMQLPTRFLFLSNELPRLNDASGALAGRFIVLRLKESFYGREDPGLGAALKAELPGILAWSIEGLKRLRRRGHFVQPASVRAAVQEMEDLLSPVSAFVRDRLHVGPQFRVWIDDLYPAWKAWCEQQGWEHVSNRQTFGRDLAAALPAIERKRGTGDRPFYKGIGLKAAVTIVPPTEEDDHAEDNVEDPDLSLLP